MKEIRTNVKIETQFDSFTLRFQDHFQKCIRVFSITGQLVFEETFSKDYIRIDSQNWEGGNYVFNVSGKAGTEKGKLFKSP